MTPADVILALAIIAFCLFFLAYLTWESGRKRARPVDTLFVGGLAVVSLVGLLGPRPLAGLLAAFLVLAAVTLGGGSVIYLLLRSPKKQVKRQGHHEKGTLSHSLEVRDVTNRGRTDASPVIIVIPREDVAAQNIHTTLGLLRTFVEGATHPSQVRGRLVVSFHGYDTDPQELWQVSEVRVFVRLLDEAFPYWFYLLDLTTDCLKMIAFCLCRVTTPMRGATAINPVDLQTFLERHFGAMNQMLDGWRASEEENIAVTEEVTRYFRSSSILN